MDYIVRATAADGMVRAFAATTRELVETARSAHGTSPVVTAALGRLLTAGAVMGSMMKGERDVLTLIIDGDGPAGKLTVTADSHGTVKGYPQEPEVLLHANAQGKLDVAGAVGRGTLKVIRDIGLREPYVGQTELVSGEIAEDITYYYAVSEQTPSSVGLGVLMNKDNTVAQAGGFFIQLMPGAGETVISALEQKLAGIRPVTAMLADGMRPEDILELLLGDFTLEILDTLPAKFYCNCHEPVCGGRTKAWKAVASLDAAEIEAMLADGQPVSVHCHFCNRDTVLDRADLEEIRRLKNDR